MYENKKELNGALACNYVVKNFGEALFLAFIRADSENLKKLEEAFPSFGRTFHGWKNYGLDLTEDEIVK